MTKHKSGSGVGFGQRRMTVEQLESRAMLAGNVTASVDGGGNLIVRGDNNDNGVLIEQLGPGKYAVSGFDLSTSGLIGVQSGPTNINGSANGTKVLTGVTGDVNVDLKRGNDALGIGNSTDDLGALADYCGFAFGNGSGSGSGSASGSVSVALVEPVAGRFFVPRNLIVNTGDGNDAIVAIADVNGSAVINTGNGNDQVAFGNAPQLESDVNVDNDLVILTGNGNDDVCVRSVTLRDHLNIQTGGGSDDVRAIAFDAGHVLAVTGGGADQVILSQFDTDREVVVDTGSGNDNAVVANFSAGQGFGPRKQTDAGYVTVVTGSGNDEAELSFFEADGVVLNTGSGNDGTPIRTESPITVADATINHQLTVVTGGGNDLVFVGFVEAHDIVIDTGSGNDGTLDFPIEINNVSVSGNLILVTGSGNDNVYIHSVPVMQPMDGGVVGSNVHGDVILNTGSGNDVAEVVDLVVGHDLNIILGAGNDRAAIGVSDESNAGNALGSLEVHQNLLLDAGSGNDIINAGNLSVHDFLFAFLGTGNDRLTVVEANVGDNVLIDASAGNDNVALIKSHVGGDANIFMGAGDDTLTVDSSSGDGKLRLFGGPGHDTFDNDLGIDSNGTFGDVEVREFEFFGGPVD